MKVYVSYFRSIVRMVYLVIGATLVGCTSTPQHTNVLIFGTNTKVALDVSQDPTSGVGVTLGYKRQEAVWMPLLPNQKSDAPGGLAPSVCTAEKDCPKFIGTDSAKQRDTYSVLASFGSKLGGGVNAQGKDAQVNGEIVQYFATGLAARLLAQNGGAGMVNTSSASQLTANQKEAIASKVITITTEQQQLVAYLADKTDPSKVDTTRRDEALAKSPGKDIPPDVQEEIKSVKTMADLQVVINDYPHHSVAKPMLDTLKAK